MKRKGKGSIGRYYGSKQRIAKQLVKVMLDYLDQHLLRNNIGQVIDCFCGTGSVSWQLAKKLNIPITASDHFQTMITTLQAIKNGWLPPTSITEKDFEDLKSNPSDPLHALVHISCSYQGRYLTDPFRLEWTNFNLSRLHRTIQNLDLRGIEFKCCKYIDYSEKTNCLIFCDPPYFTANQSQWPENYKGFLHDDFWPWVRMMSENNVVLVTEFTAPDDFECLWSKSTKGTNRHFDCKGRTRIEKLWVMRNCYG